MAARYWVGNTGTWDASDTTHWSTSSGGAGGASVPTSSDNVIIDGNSFSLAGQTITLSDVRPCADLDFSAVTHTPQLYFSGFLSCNIAVYGNLTLASGMVLTTDSTGAGFYMYAASGTKTINTAGLPFDGTLQIMDVATFSFQSNCNFLIYVQDFAAAGGVVNTNDYTLSLGYFSLDGGTFNAGASTINIAGQLSETIGSNVWLISNSSPTAIFNGQSSTINVVFVKTFGFATSTQNYNKIVFDTGALAYFSLNGNPTIATLQLNPGQEMQFDGNFSGQFIVTNFIANGLPTSHITIHMDGVPDQFDMVAANVSLSYLDVADGNALGAAAPFTVVNGVDNGNNTNWVFSNGPQPTFTNTPGAYNPLAHGEGATDQKPNGSGILQQKPQGSTIRTGKPTLA